MIEHSDIDNDTLMKTIRRGQISFGGNKNLKIYGTLACASGKRMKRKNRVFFSSVHEAIDAGYRPCGNCLKTEYGQWIESQKNEM